MTKDEILEKSRSDNGGKDIEDLEAQKSSAKIAYFSSLGFCILLSFINYIFTKKMSVQCWIVFFGMLSVSFFVKFFKLKKWHELFVAICYLVIFILLLVTFILQFTGKLNGNAGAIL